MQEHINQLSWTYCKNRIKIEFKLLYSKNTEEKTVEKLRAKLKDKKRVVVKIGSSSLQHPETGDLDYTKMDILVRELCNIRNQGRMSFWLPRGQSAAAESHFT